jgi:hypothetical protein
MFWKSGDWKDYKRKCKLEERGNYLIKREA